MAAHPILLKALLRGRHWQKYATFCAEYEKAARTVDPKLVKTTPSRQQLYRWMSGQVKSGLPYPDHCRVLEAMFPGHTARELLSPAAPDDLVDQDLTIAQPHGSETADALYSGRSGMEQRVESQRYADVAAIFASRAEFISVMSPHTLFDDAQAIDAAGLSLNLVCQQYPDGHLRRLVRNGTRIRCLFLDPDGAAIRAREQEERHVAGHLSTLTRLNIHMLERVRDRLPDGARDRVEIGVYDETIRFNIIIVDTRIGIVQPYLPEARGLDSPTFVVERRPDCAGLFAVFEEIWNSLWERRKPL